MLAFQQIRSAVLIST